jgi:VIT1/CCC1 family predicted Fe2+/Mn2+ transporter
MTMDPTQAPMDPTQLANAKRYADNLRDELNGAALYRALAQAEPDPDRKDLFLQLAQAEANHATLWRDKLVAAGVEPKPFVPSWRTRMLGRLAKRFGVRFVLPTIAAAEFADRNKYAGQSDAHAISAEERGHAAVVQAIAQRGAGVAGAVTGADIARAEPWHRNASGNNLRAAVLGANDGLVSNFCLLMGVAGAGSPNGVVLLAGGGNLRAAVFGVNDGLVSNGALILGIAGASPDPRVVLMTGVAGLVAGACSMALGEWLSVTNARELASTQLAREAQEIEQTPAAEQHELALIFQAKGVSKDEARRVAAQVMQDKKGALDTLAREELGIDPAELGGNPWSAAGTSFVLFALGALFPILPFVWLTGGAGTLASVATSALALAAIGTLTSLFNGRGAWFSAARQVVFGCIAAAVTYGAGALLGVSLS